MCRQTSPVDPPLRDLLIIGRPGRTSKAGPCDNRRDGIRTAARGGLARGGRTGCSIRAAGGLPVRRRGRRRLRLRVAAGRPRPPALPRLLLRAGAAAALRVRAGWLAARRVLVRVPWALGGLRG